jgi:hypothetical protein
VRCRGCVRGSPMCQPCNSRPRLPSGCSRLWSGPATKPSNEIDIWQVASDTVNRPNDCDLQTVARAVAGSGKPQALYAALRRRDQTPQPQTSPFCVVARRAIASHRLAATAASTSGYRWAVPGEIYQIKRYSFPLKTAQAKDIEKSWNTFVAETLPALSVSAWHLVTPWDPTNERLEWLERLTAGSGVKTDWIGRSQLDFFAAQHPQLVAYFQGDGAERLQQLITSALHGGSLPSDGASGEVLLDEVVSRQMALADSLDEVDPFYRYEAEVRSGPLTEDRLADAPAGGRGAAMIVYRQVSEDRHIALHIIPGDAMALLIRPITRTVSLDVSDPEHRDIVDRFVRYGVPIEQVPAVTVRSEGPPATHPSGAQGLISFLVPKRNDLPELDLRLRAADGSVVHALPLDRAEVSLGFDGVGMRIAAWDSSHSLHAEFLLSQSPDLDEELTIGTSTLSGKPATAVINGNTSDYWHFEYSLNQVSGGLWRLDVGYQCAVNKTGVADDYCTVITYPDGNKDVGVTASHSTQIHDLATGNTTNNQTTGFFGTHSTPAPSGSKQVVKYAQLYETAYFQQYNVYDHASIRTFDVCVPNKATFSGVTLCAASGTGT